MRVPVAALATTLLVATLSVAIAQGTKQQLSFTADQVTRGRNAYLANCAYCHGVDLGGHYGPALAGPNTKVSWGTGGGLWGFTTTQTPDGNPGGLSQNDYLNIVAYILERNGQRPGKQTMTVPLIANDQNLVGGAAR
jgi:mono/diheme cytochrome c family protein